MWEDIRPYEREIMRKVAGIFQSIQYRIQVYMVSMRDESVHRLHAFAGSAAGVGTEDANMS